MGLDKIQEKNLISTVLKAEWEHKTRAKLCSARVLQIKLLYHTVGTPSTYLQ